MTKMEKTVNTENEQINQQIGKCVYAYVYLHVCVYMYVFVCVSHVFLWLSEGTDVFLG